MLIVVSYVIFLYIITGMFLLCKSQLAMINVANKNNNKKFVLIFTLAQKYTN